MRSKQAELGWVRVLVQSESPFLVTLGDSTVVGLTVYAMQHGQLSPPPSSLHRIITPQLGPGTRAGPEQGPSRAPELLEPYLRLL